MDLKLKKYLDDNGIIYDAYEHKAVFTVEESKKLKAEIPGMHCKTLFLKDTENRRFSVPKTSHLKEVLGNKGKFYLIGMPAEKRLDSKKFRKLLSLKKIRFGTEEELKDEVNLIPGSVSIFGMVNCSGDVKLIIDKEVWEAEKVGFHPNVNTATIVVTHENLKRYYGSLDCEKEVLEL